jgi:hypothetical protein
MCLLLLARIRLAVSRERDDENELAFIRSNLFERKQPAMRAVIVRKL